MATRKPLVLAGGDRQQLQSADDLVINGLTAFHSGGLNIGGATDPGAGNLYLVNTASICRLRISSGSSSLVDLWSSNAASGWRNWTILTGWVAAGDFAILQSSALGGDPTSGVTRLYISAAGGVNIGGTADPGANSLSVAASIYAVGGLTVGATSPAAGTGNLWLQGNTDSNIRFATSANGYGGSESIRVYSSASGSAWNNGYLAIQVHSTNTGVFVDTIKFFGTGGINIGGNTDPGLGSLIVNGGLIDLVGVVATKKLLLYHVGNANYGFGIASNELRMFTPGGVGETADRLVIGSIAVSDGTTFTETARIYTQGGWNIGGTTDPGIGSLTIAKRFVGPIVTVTYSSSITIDASLGNLFVITITNLTAFTMNAPTNPTTGQVIAITFRMTSGSSAVNSPAWNAVFKLSASPAPSTGFNGTIMFEYNGTNWIQINTVNNNVPN